MIVLNPLTQLISWDESLTENKNKNFNFVYRFAVACTYYGLSLNIEGFGVNIYLTQFIFGTIEVPGKALIYFTVKKIGRRFSQAGSLVLTGLCVLCNIFIPQGKSAPVCGS